MPLKNFYTIKETLWKNRLMDEKKRDPVEISGRLLARNALLNLIGQVVPFLIGLITIPLIIRGLGTERFGLLSLVWVVLGYFSIFDLGLGRATTKFVAEALGRGEEEQVPRLVWTAVTVQAVWGLLGAFILIGITPLLVDRILNIPPKLVGEARATFYLLAIAIPVVLVSGSFSGVLQAKQRFDLLNAVSILSSILTYLLTLVGLFFGFHLPGIVGLILISRFIAISALVALTLRIFPKLKKFSAQFALFPRLFSFGGWVMVSNMLAPFLGYIDRFMIGTLLSLSAVTFYTVPFDILTRLWIIPSSLVMTLFPAFSALGIRKVDLQRLYVRSIKYLLLVTGPIVLILTVFAGSILRLWLGPEFAQQSTVVFQILLLGILIGLLAPVSGSLLQGVGRPDLLSKLYLLEVPLNIGLVWFLVQAMGISGAALSFTLRAWFETVALFVLSSKLIHLSYNSFIENGLWRSVVALLALGGVLWAISFTQLFLFRIGFVIVLLLAFALISLRYVLDDTDRKIITSVTPKFLSPKGSG